MMLVVAVLAVSLAQAAEPVPVTDAADLAWTKRPIIEYPARALYMEAPSGEIVVECAVVASGALSECVVREETPKDMGFGQAVLLGLRVAQLEASRWTEPRVAIRFRFRIAN